MKIDRDHFYSVIGRVKKCTGSLRNGALFADGKIYTDNGQSLSIEVVLDTGLDHVLSVHDIYNWLSNTTCKELHIEEHPSGQIVLECGGSKMSLTKLARDMFTKGFEPSGEKYELDCTLADLTTIARCSANLKDRPQMSGVVVGDGIMAATNGQRVGWIEIDGYDGERFMIPPDIIEVIKGVEAPLNMTLGDSAVFIEFGDTAIGCQLMEYKVPNVSAVVGNYLDKDCQVKFKAGSDSIVEAVKRSSVCSIAGADLSPPFDLKVSEGALTGRTAGTRTITVSNLEADIESVADDYEVSRWGNGNLIACLSTHEGHANHCIREYSPGQYVWDTDSGKFKSRIVSMRG